MKRVPLNPFCLPPISQETDASGEDLPDYDYSAEEDDEAAAAAAELAEDEVCNPSSLSLCSFFCHLMPHFLLLAPSGLVERRSLGRCGGPSNCCRCRCPGA